jgi:ABC-2 type transport system ATP-binding protein
MEEAEQCDRIILLRDGKLLAHDTPEALKKKTKTKDTESAFLHLVRSRA